MTHQPEQKVFEMARRAGVAKYQTTVRCDRGHLGLRYVDTGACHQCAKDDGIAHAPASQGRAGATLLARWKARDEGALSYSTGFLCRRGHMAPRGVWSNRCLTCYPE